jgi:hypothetical protein
MTPDRSFARACRLRAPKRLLHAFVGLLLALAGTTEAEPLCIRAVPGGEPVLEVEREQPYRIATNPRQVPGFPGLVVQAMNRHALLHFDGQRLREINQAFPHVWGFAFSHGIHVTPNGDAYGFGGNPRAIFHIAAGAADWQPIPTTRDYLRALFDRGSGDVYMFPRGERRLDAGPPVLIRNGQVIGAASLPGTERAPVVSIRTITELSVTLAVTVAGRYAPDPDVDLWFRPAAGGAWRRLAAEVQQSELPRDLDAVDIRIDGDLLKLFPHSWHLAPIFLRVDGRELTYAGAAPPGLWRYHAASRSWIGWVGEFVQEVSQPRWWFFQDSAEPVPPRLALVRDGLAYATFVPNLVPPSRISGRKAFFRPNIWLLDPPGPALIPGVHGVWVFDGTSFEAPAELRYERIGTFPGIRTLGEVDIIQSEKGIFRLDADLSATPVSGFPFAEPWRPQFTLGYVPAWQSYWAIDRRSGALMISTDFERFERVPSPAGIHGAVGHVDDPTSLLLVGEDRLYMLTAACAP